MSQNKTQELFRFLRAIDVEAKQATEPFLKFKGNQFWKSASLMGNMQKCKKKSVLNVRE